MQGRLGDAGKLLEHHPERADSSYNVCDFSVIHCLLNICRQGRTLGGWVVGTRQTFISQPILREMSVHGMSLEIMVQDMCDT